MDSAPPKRSIVGPLVILLIIFLVIIAVFAIPLGFFYFKSRSECGNEGILTGSANKGYSCMYHSTCQNCNNYTQCPVCSQLCASKGKIESGGYCGPSEIDLTNKIKRNEQGNLYIEELPVECYCCCD